MLNENKLNQRMTSLMGSGFFGVLKESDDPKGVFDSEEIQKLKDMIESGQEDNFELAFGIIEGRGVSKEMFLDKYYGEDFIGLLKLAGLSFSPEDIAKLLGIKDIFLDYKKLTTLPESIGILIHLRALWLSGNQLTTLPDSIGNLTSLKTLTLESNQLTSLPDSIGNLTNLKHLNLAGNLLTSLPDSIGNLQNLESLYLEENHLTSIPKSIGNLQNLRTLYLEGNSFFSFEKKELINKLNNCKIYF
jgi:Leucine-rich repeat (LRR) protein